MKLPFLTLTALLLASHALLPAADATYRSTLSQLTSQREQRLQTLREKFLQALDAYQAELTRAKNLDAALEVRKRRDLEAASAKAP